MEYGVQRKGDTKMFGYAEFYNRGIVAENPDYAIKEFEGFVNYAKTMGWIDNVKLFSDACKVRKENDWNRIC